MSCPYIFTGFFIEAKTLFPAVKALRVLPLKNEVEYPHLTLVFHPDSVDETLFGTEAEITVTGYGNDGVNEGVSVSMLCENEALQQMIDAVAVPHITLAVSENGKPVDTARLHFEPVEPVTLRGVFGGFLKKEARPVLSAREEA